MLQLIIDLINDIRKRGLGAVAGRYYGIYLGTVTDNADPDKKGRVQVYADIFPGSKNYKENPYNNWIPCKSLYAGSQMGMFFPPEIGSKVFIQFVDGDYGRPYYDGGTWAGEPSPYPSDHQTEKPTLRGIKTAQGFEITFQEDTENGKTGMWIMTPAGNKVNIVDKGDKAGILITSIKNKVE
jgi:uncharacterized protein involved in type VI secretion and phage assembly